MAFSISFSLDFGGIVFIPANVTSDSVEADQGIKSA